MKRIYRVHGDNIIECEVAVSIILEAIQFSTDHEYKIELIESTAVTPSYAVKFDNGLSFIFEFFPGHNRWNVSLHEFLALRGAPLRESVDALVTLVSEDTEKPIAAFEFCNALPAGNNAWQRAGRALSMVGAKIPYFYFAEIGGQELDADRKIKAPRFPNPIVPFSYLSISSAAPEKCTTIYLPSRSISKKTYEEFKDAFANNEHKHGIASLFVKGTNSGSLENSKDKSAQFVYDLAKRRRSNNTHKLKSWESFLLSARSGSPIAKSILNDQLKWAKKLSIPSQPTLTKLINSLSKCGVVAIGSIDMPFCILPGNKRIELANQLKSIYDDSISDGFTEWVKSSEKDLVIVLIAGFKPRGDDSRPDRGLVPLARMIFANDDVDLLSVLYGPAKTRTWDKLFADPRWLARNNGLWEAIINLSNAVLVDSTTFGAGYKIRDVVLENQTDKVVDAELVRFSNIPRYGEHDVDSVLHLLFSGAEDHKVFESLCNPPGGDWSGVSFVDKEGATNRWTSLPRVTGIKGKRPDHIVQFFGDQKIILSVESKDILRNLEDGVGPRLNHYTRELLVNGAAQSRKLKDSLEWSQEIDVNILKETVDEYDFFSAVAVMGDGTSAKSALQKSSSEASFAISFANDGSTELFFSSESQSLKRLVLDYLRSQQPKLKLLNIKLSSIN